MNGHWTHFPRPAWGVICCVPLLVGCGLGEQIGSPTATQTPSRTGTAAAPTRPEAEVGELPPPGKVDDLSLPAMCRRVAELAGQEVSAYRQQLAQTGLIVPATTDLAVAVDASASACPRKLLAANRVRDELAEHVARLAGINPVSGVGEGCEAVKLNIKVPTDFATPFRAIQCEFVFQTGEKRRTVWDRFDSAGFVRIRWPAASPQMFVVNAVRERLPLDFAVAADQWFMLDRGNYDSIKVHSPTGVWSPPSLVVGLQTLWYPASASAAGSDPSPMPPSLAAESETNGVREPPQLVLVSPAAGEEVPRIVTVSGRAFGLEDAEVEVVVIVDKEYLQDGRAVVRGGTWSLSGCYVGRPEGDEGASFSLKARARSAAYGIVESDVVVVSRK